jgi:hypothetical protein
LGQAVIADRVTEGRRDACRHLFVEPSDRRKFKSAASVSASRDRRISTEKRGFSPSAYWPAASCVIHAGMQASELSGCTITTSSTPRTRLRVELTVAARISREFEQPFGENMLTILVRRRLTAENAMPSFPTQFRPSCSELLFLVAPADAGWAQSQPRRAGRSQSAARILPALGPRSRPPGGTVDPSGSR